MARWAPTSGGRIHRQPGSNRHRYHVNVAFMRSRTLIVADLCSKAHRPRGRPVSTKMFPVAPSTTDRQRPPAASESRIAPASPPGQPIRSPASSPGREGARPAARVRQRRWLPVRPTNRRLPRATPARHPLPPDLRNGKGCRSPRRPCVRWGRWRAARPGAARRPDGRHRRAARRRQIALLPRNPLAAVRRHVRVDRPAKTSPHRGRPPDRRRSDVDQRDFGPIDEDRARRTGREPHSMNEQARSTPCHVCSIDAERRQ
jgi:hypothetical protein